MKQPWKDENNWLVPPPALASETIHKICKEKCSCTLVVPEWKSAPYWPLLFGNRTVFAAVKNIVYLQGHNVTHRGRGRNGIFGQVDQKFRFMFVRFEH